METWRYILAGLLAALSLPYLLMNAWLFLRCHFGKLHGNHSPVPLMGALLAGSAGWLVWGKAGTLLALSDLSVWSLIALPIVWPCIFIAHLLRRKRAGEK